MDETLEEAFEKWADQKSEKGVGYDKFDVLQFGAKWQQERMYTEQEVITLLEKRDDELDYWYVHKRNNYPHLTDWFEEYKKK